MCGICGVAQIGGEPREVIDRAALERMTDVMTHRGPNDRGVYSAPGIALGVRRLSIVDVAGGHQPVSNEDERVWAVQNGELYNHEAIHAELAHRGHLLHTRCDTEILPHLFEDVAEELPARLRGKFAIAVWDGRTRRTLVARDRAGVKPLYFAVAGDVVVFASELKSVLASGLVGLELDLEAIDVYLTLGYFPAPLTPLAQVRKLPPGHRLVIGDGEVRVEPYWEFPLPEPDRTLTEDDAAEQLLAELEEAVRLRLMAEVPLGAMLSGGLDSSLIVALMARNMSEPVKTFSVGFVEDGAGSELPDAARVASAFGTDHHPLELSMNDSAVALEDLVWALDEPVADLSALGFMALSELAARDVTVALAGQGSDELFGGYSRHRRAALIDRAGGPARPVASIAARALGSRGGRYARFAHAAASTDNGSRYLALRTPFLEPALRERIAREPIRTDDRRALDVVRASAVGLNGDGALASTLYLDSRLGLVDDMLHYSDRVSMAHSLEVRVPFLDHEVIALAARIPDSLKVRGGETKVIVKRIARDVLPAEIVDKPKTGFFNRAVDAWLRRQLDAGAADVLLREDAAYAGFLDGGAVRSAVSGARAGGRFAPDSLYALLVLEVWLSSFLPRAAAEARRPVPVAG
jgi:asparagine synthase (glutamine-hydrolysing)